MRTLLLAALLTAQLATPALAKNIYIPAAAVAPGSNGTFWRTDVRIFNPSIFDDIDVTLHFLPQGQDGRNIPGRMFHIGKRETLVLDDVVSILAPHVTSAVGAIHIDSDTDRSYEFIATLRTYTISPDPARPGTFGQFVPALEEADARTSTAMPQIAVRPDVRTNAGVMNPGYEEVWLRVSVLGTDGRVFLRSERLAVPPKSMRQWSLAELFGGIFIGDGTLTIEADIPVFTWASVIDNQSGDAIFVRGADSHRQ